MKDEKKWLEDMFLYFNATEEFVDEMYKQLPEQYNEIVFKQLDWSKIKLFIEPRNDNKENYFQYDFLDDKYEGYIIAELQYERFSMGTEIGYSVDSRKKIHPNEYDGSVKIEFYVVHLCMSRYLRDIFPMVGEEENEDREPLDYNFKFPVYCVNGKGFIHEGHFMINMNEKDLRAIQEIIGKSLSKWNNENVSIENIDIKESRGYFHSFGFEEWEEGKAKFYFDSGSAQDGVFEYLLSELDKSDIIINSIEIT